LLSHHPSGLEWGHAVVATCYIGTSTIRLRLTQVSTARDLPPQTTYIPCWVQHLWCVHGVCTASMCVLTQFLAIHQQLKPQAASKRDAHVMQASVNDIHAVQPCLTQHFLYDQHTNIWEHSQGPVQAHHCCRTTVQRRGCVRSKKRAAHGHSTMLQPSGRPAGTHCTLTYTVQAMQAVPQYTAANHC
jgi:hypothetical protein